MSTLKAVTDATFEEDVLRSEVPVIVDFWAEWCGPCRMLTPILEELAEEHADKVKVVAVNVDENPVTAAELGIISIPSVYGFKDGERVHTTTGAKPKAALEAEFSDFLA